MDVLPKDPGAAPAGTPLAPLASSSPAGGPPKPPAPVAAASSVPEYGGNPSGRPLVKFKHPPGTPEGEQERRDAEAKRKREERAAARAVAQRLAEPPPLPSATAPAPGPQPAPTPGVAPGQVDSPGPAPLPWQGDALAPLFDELLEAAEDGRVGQYVAKCSQAGLMPKLIKEIEADAHFPKSAKVILKNALPRLAAKWLNKSGISAEYQDEVACVTALLLIVQHDRKMSGKLDELIAIARASRRDPEAEKKAA